MATKEQVETHESVSEYYGKILHKTEDLKTDACCTKSRPPKHIAEAMSLIHDEVAERYYGCGLTIPHLLEGLTVLDLGCGAGRDVYILSKLVGEHGLAMGVDMTPEQLEVANRHVDFHTKQFGYSKPNVKFIQGFIEDLSLIKSESVDVIVSNCVINLSPDKKSVLSEACRVLKNGGELYFSDVYSDRRIPEHLLKDQVLLGECLSGALYFNDFLRIAKSVGFADPRLVEDRPIVIGNEKIGELLAPAKFYSATYRLFKLPAGTLESDCEDYGQAVIYKGTIPTCKDTFVLDSHHKIQAKKVFPVCGNTFAMLKDTRFAPHFQFIGDRSVHFGLFPGCGKTIPFGSGCDSSSSCGSSNKSCC